MTPRRRLALSVALIAAALVALHARAPGADPPGRRTLAEFPTALGEWEASEGALLEPGILDVLRPTDYLLRRDQDRAGRDLWLFIGYWDSQRRGDKPHSPRDCLPAGGWEPVDVSRLTIPLPEPHGRIVVNRYLVQKHREQQLVLYWYQAHGAAIAGDLAARMEMLRSSVTRGRADGALIRISSPLHGDLQQATDRLTAYVQALYPVLGEFLPS
jgi:EpsI family protein